MSLTNEIIQQTLSQQFTPKVENFHILHDMLAFEVKKEASFEVIKFLKEDPSMNFNFLTDVCGVHYPDYEEDRQFCVVYHLHNWFDNIRVRVKVFLPANNPEAESIVPL